MCTSLKAAFLTGGTLNDFGFNYAIFEGVQKLQADYPTLTIDLKVNVSFADCQSTLENWINLGFDVIFVPHVPYLSCSTSVAAAHPNTKFVLNVPNENHPNLTNVAADFRSGLDKARFLTGVLAAKQKDTSKICMIMPKPYSEKERWSNHVLLGMRHVSNNDNLHLGLSLNFDDRTTEERVVNHFISYGCDVIIQQALNSIFVQELVANASKLGMGQHTDMRDFVGESVLTSIETNWNVMFSYYIEKIKAGTFVNELFIDNLMNGGISLSDFSCEVSKAARKTTNRVKEQLFSGVVNPLCEPHILTVFGTPCINETQISAAYFPGITVYDGTVA